LHQPGQVLVDGRTRFCELRSYIVRTGTGRAAGLKLGEILNNRGWDVPFGHAGAKSIGYEKTPVILWICRISMRNP
jgi:hypothetical protein